MKTMSICYIRDPFGTKECAPLLAVCSQKRKHTDMQQRCARQNLGFEPLVLESAGGFCGETATLLQSLAKMVDTMSPLVTPGNSCRSVFPLIYKGGCTEPASNRGNGGAVAPFP